MVVASLFGSLFYGLRVERCGSPMGSALVTLSPVVADVKLSEAETKTMTVALAVLACAGGTIEKKVVASNIFGFDEAKCKHG